MKKLWAVLIAAAALLLLGLAVAGWYVFSVFLSQGRLLAKPPSHGIQYVLALQIDEGVNTTNATALLREILRKRFARHGARIYFEPLSSARVQVVATLKGPPELLLGEALITRRGLLEFRFAHDESENLMQDGLKPTGYEVLERVSTNATHGERAEKLLVRKKAEPGLSGDLVRSAIVLRNKGGNPEVCIQLKPASTDAFKRTTQENIGRRLAIVIDGKLISAPRIQTMIPSGKAKLTGGLDQLECRELAAVLESPLPMAITIVESKQF